jgi:hypothetical protein
MSKSKDIGNAGERNHRRILRPLWPDIVRYPDRYHPTRDHDNTGPFHVESKKRATWNIKDVVVSQARVQGPWIIAYEDRNRTKVGNPSIAVGILPLDQLAEILIYARKGGYNV